VGSSLPTTINALVVRVLVIHDTASDVVLGFIGWAIGHPPENDSDAIAGFTSRAFSLHGAKLLRVTDKLEADKAVF